MSAPAPKRIQLKRTKGWRMPPNTVKVDRTTKWGNPFVAHKSVAAGQQRAGSGSGFLIAVATTEDAVECFAEFMRSEGQRAAFYRSGLPELRGKDLACWCKIGEPCHADVLLELANK